MDWCVAYTPRQIDNKGVVDAGVHGVFFSACQVTDSVLKLVSVNLDGVFLIPYVAGCYVCP